MLGALQSVRLRETNLPLESYVASIGKDDHHSRSGTPSPRVRDPHCWVLSPRATMSQTSRRQPHPHICNNTLFGDESVDLTEPGSEEDHIDAVAGPLQHCAIGFKLSCLDE